MDTNDKQKAKNLTFGTAFLDAIGSNPVSLLVFIFNVPFFIFTVGMFIYQTSLAMRNLTTYENLKGTYSEVPFSPFSSRSLFKNLFLRIFENVPKTMLIPQLRIPQEVWIHTTKAELERKFDIKKTVMGVIDDEDKKKNNDILKRRHEYFK